MLVLRAIVVVCMALGACVDTRGSSLPEGMPAPDFELAASDGRMVRLSAVNADRWAVLVFYRGDW